MRMSHSRPQRVASPRFLGAALGLAIPLLVGCGAAGDGGTGAAGGSTPEQLEDAASLAMVRAHQTASLRLYATGEASQAAKHAGHPIEEIFWSVSRSLRSKDAALTADLRKALKAPADLIFSKAPRARLEAAYGQAWSQLDRAEATLVPDSVRTTATYRAQLVARLLQTAQAEYGEAFDAGHIVKPIEYNDAWAAVGEARRRFSAWRPGFGDGAAAIEQSLAALEKALPTVQPPASAAPLGTVQRLADTAIAKLGTVAGTSVASNPVAEIDAARRLLSKARTSYSAGKPKPAEGYVAEAYLQHFEKVEPALGKRDKALMERLEVLIATDLRDRIKAGAPVSEVNALLRQAREGLGKARAILDRKR